MEQNPFSQFNPFLFLNNTSEQLNNQFNPFQAGGFGFGGMNSNPWMQNMTQNNDIASKMQEWQKYWINQTSSSYSPQDINNWINNPYLQNINQMMGNSFSPMMSVNQEFISKMQDWQKDMQQVMSTKWQQNLINAMLDASKSGAHCFSEQMSNLVSNWKKNDLEKFINNPLLAELEVAIKSGDLNAQKGILEKICKQWVDYAKNLQKLNAITYSDKSWLIKGYKKVIDDSLLVFEKMQSRHFDNQDQENLKNYLACLSHLFDDFNDLIENFSDFESELVDEFINAALSSEIEIKDINELFNLWCQKFDQCYNKKVLTDKYQQSFADWVNGISEFKIAAQKIIDRMVEQAGLPSNREMNTVHKRLHQVFKENAALKKQLAEMKNQLEKLAEANLKTKQEAQTKASTRIKK